MKFNIEITINQPIAKVIELFDNTENMKQWMQGLESFEHLSGTPGEVGSVSKLKFKRGKRELEMIETITVKNLPEEFSGTYLANGVFNIVKNKFIPLSDTTTKYLSQQEFRFTGFMRIIGFLMPGAFRDQSMKYLMTFKYFAENQK